MSGDKTSLGSNYAQLTTLFSVAERTLDSEVAVAGRFLRRILANGLQSFIQTLYQSKFTLEGNKLLTSAFLAFFKRCALLWKLLLQESNVNKHCSQRLLLKLDYSQKLTSRIFHEANMDEKLSLGGSTDAGVIILDLCVSALQILPGMHA